jgi:hypothetical protein
MVRMYEEVQPAGGWQAFMSQLNTQSIKQLNNGSLLWRTEVSNSDLPDYWSDGKIWSLQRKSTSLEPDVITEPSK